MREKLIAKLPPSELRKKAISKRQDVPEIMDEVCAAHICFADHYDRIGTEFWTGSIYGTIKKLFDFCKANMTYAIETEKSQTTRSPQAILKTAHTWGVDCKHYAGFIGGCLDAINRAGLANISWCYRFASYNENDPMPEHVFVVVNDGDKNIFVDPVLSSLDLRTPGYHFKVDKFPAMLNRISGLSSQTVRSRSVGYVQPYADEYTSGGGGGGYVKPPSTLDNLQPNYNALTLPPGVTDFIQKNDVVPEKPAPDIQTMLPTAVNTSGNGSGSNWVLWALVIAGIYFISKK